jgi:predicted glycoside hydrolase/deacetylase ChbG (UPF0249 family)
MARYLIVNADDFGNSEGINQAIADCHRAGTVTSASLMATGKAAAHAAQFARELPRLSVGLHWVGDRPGVAIVDLDDGQAVAAELDRQLELFAGLLGRAPTHLDSHHHVHLASATAMEAFRAAAARLRIPVRGDGSLRFVGDFYGQSEDGATDLRRVSVAALERILREKVVAEGWTEIGCHPGYATERLRSAYTREREAEAATLTDPRVSRLIAELGIELAGHGDFARSRVASRRAR